jgi:hypothetical protein
MSYAELLYEVNAAANIFTGYTTHNIFIAEHSRSIPGCSVIGSSFYLSAIAQVVISCDYTFIGQELFAAGAYISKEPEQTGYLRTVDIINGIMIGVMILGSILVSSGINFIAWLGV